MKLITLNCNQLGVTFFGSLYPVLGKRVNNLLMGIYLAFSFLPFTLLFKERTYENKSVIDSPKKQICCEEISNLTQNNKPKIEKPLQMNELLSPNDEEIEWSGNVPAANNQPKPTDQKTKKDFIWYKDYVLLLLIICMQLNSTYAVEEFMAYYLKDIIGPEHFTIPIPAFFWSTHPKESVAPKCLEIPPLPKSVLLMLENSEANVIPNRSPPTLETDIGIGLRYVQFTKSVETAEALPMFVNNFCGVFSALISGFECSFSFFRYDIWN